VYVPGAIITTHQKQPLMAFGQAPFSVVCMHSHLRTASSQFLVTNQITGSEKAPHTSFESVQLNPSSESPDQPPNISTHLDLDDLPAVQLADAQISDLILGSTSCVAIGEKPILASFEVDTESQQDGE
jgi:hypothetical protein